MTFPATVHVQGVLLKNFIAGDFNETNGRVLTWMPLHALLPDVDRGHSEYGGTGLMDVAKALRRGFAYIEIEKPPQSSNPLFQKSFEWMGGISGAPFTRFSLSISGDPDCVQYEKEAADSLKYHQLRSLPQGECVAARAATHSESVYAIAVVELKDEPSGRSPYWEPPTLWTIVDLGANKTYAQMYRREAGDAFSCPAFPQRNRFYDIIQPMKAAEGEPKVEHEADAGHAQ